MRSWKLGGSPYEVITLKRMNRRKKTPGVQKPGVFKYNFCEEKTPGLENSSIPPKGFELQGYKLIWREMPD